MLKFKQYIKLLTCGLLIMVTPSYAVPTFDVPHDIHAIFETTTVYQSLQNLKKQMEEIAQLQHALGEIDNITSFATFIGANKINIADINDNLKTRVAIQDNLGEYVKNVNDVQISMTEYLVNNVEEKIIKTNTKKSAKFIIDDEIVLAENLLSIEEEEEEAIDVSVIKAEVQPIFDITTEKTMEIANQFNDAIDEVIYTMNLEADINSKHMKNLTIWSQKESNVDQKLRDEIIELAKQEQDVSDESIIIAENLKKNYNIEYKEKIKDGINNYKKIIMAYTEGMVSEKEIIIAGSALQTNVKTFEKLLQNYKQDINSIKEKTAKITNNIEKIYNDNLEIFQDS